MFLLEVFASLMALMLAVPLPFPLVRATFTSDEKKEFVVVHNRLRETAVPTASAMNFVIWDEELERLAQAAANKCEFQHSSGGEYKGRGENIWYSSTSTPPKDITMDWFSEKSAFDHAKKVCTGSVCNHYLTMMFDDVRQLGCGIKRDCVRNGLVVSFVFCEYSVIQSGVFRYGPQCSECPVDMPLCLNGLCISAALLEQQVAKDVDSTVTTSAGKCLLACKNCGKLDASAGNCKCTCGADGTGSVCEVKSAGSSANCPACPGHPPCLNGGEVDTAVTLKCKCKCKTGFVGDRCETAKADWDNSVTLVLATATVHKIFEFAVMPPVARSLFNSKIWSVLLQKLVTIVNDYCRASKENFEKCCPGKTFPAAAIVTTVTHVSDTDFKLIESSIGNYADGSLKIGINAMARSSSSLCAAGTGGAAFHATYVPPTLMTSAIAQKIDTISVALKACCNDVLLKSVSAGLADPKSANILESNQMVFAVVATFLLFFFA